MILLNLKNKEKREYKMYWLELTKEEIEEILAQNPNWIETQIQW